MVGKVVSIQAWRKESAVSGGYIHSVKIKSLYVPWILCCSDGREGR